MSKIFSRLRSTKVLLFPGQGRFDVNSLSSLTKYQNVPVVQSLLAQTDKTLPSLRLSEFITDPATALAKKDIQLTSIQQPLLILTSSVTYHLLRAVKNENILNNTDFLLGHSVGEICALVAQDSIPFASGLELAYKRGVLMEKLVEETGKSYSMQALLFQPTHYKYITQILGELDVQVSNYNNYQQLVVSGETHELSQKINQLKARIAKAGVWKTRVHSIDLGVKIPFHNPVLQPIESELEQLFEKTVPVKRSLGVPMVSNLNGEMVAEVNTQVKNIVQATSKPVQFLKCLEMLTSLDDEFEFISFGDTTTKIIQKYFQDAQKLNNLQAKFSTKTIDELLSE
ncbi:hypothetical protein KL918_003107 [Ogataea parapolymorpha]|uniref:[acyl-carrier-protein] S-malonyltransferase n=1 Tax=Ogataea parapolymorpha (strain ATCC 26012 / BCRC 20466 / JCM 22074 / NRRL Y-7560 / DL-1) TaxID=871575 RepID=W1QBL2_OGAPD|nr:hypothetical protein HPODL_01814 [Ogataea parapolymorpha DL-1]ESW97728.1 hypothetical protein HPODL_01814 [Ogataea parapolymorpha DL-1]KAG7866912.1 hypothetical protein KL918_003107 [Ogataea parapolymorpha]KAG7871242.1 hypothetical protein KL916_004241 [Ogataea parapolymorpha]